MRKREQFWLIPFVRVAMASAVLSVPAWFAHAQSQTQAPAAGSSSIPDEKLDAAAAALVRATSIKESYDHQMAGAATQSAKAALAKKADDEAAKAITDQGLTMQEYATILKVAKNDATVREQLIRRMSSIE